MDFENELIPGVLIKRYKRFFVDIKLKDKIITAHCPNPGSMLGLREEGSKIWVQKTENLKAKLPFVWKLVEIDNGTFF